jgi:hypothetical protein
MAKTKKSELEETHAIYKKYSAAWAFYIASYFGGVEYAAGNYLLRHPRETSANYTRRKAIAYYYNYCGSIIDIFVSHIFRKTIEYDYAELDGEELFEQFLKNADFDGASFKQFMRDAGRYAQAYGRVGIFVDKSPSIADNKAEEVEAGLRPYLCMITPENVLDWKHERTETGAVVLTFLKIREVVSEKETVYRLWWRDRWEKWSVKKNKKAVQIGGDDHDLEEIPLITLYNRRSGRKMVGLSDLADLAEINKNIYYLCSDAKEIIENAAYPFLAKPYGKKDKNGVVEGGSGNVLEFDPSEANAKPFWLEAPHTSLAEIRMWVLNNIDEIFRIAKMGGVRAQETKQIASGIALKLEQDQLHSSLAEKADNLEHAESEIFRLYAKFMDVEFTGSVNYPDKFNIDDVVADLDNLLKASTLRIESETFQKESQKKGARLALQDADEETLVLIDEEIDANVLSKADEDADLLKGLNAGGKGEEGEENGEQE